MKVKLLTAVAISSLLASVSFAAAPVDQATEDSSMTANALANGAADENVGSMPNSNGNEMLSQNNVGGVNTPAATAEPGNANDEMSADTATGDDDY